MSQALYAVWPDQARRSWGWAALLVVLVSYIASTLPLVLVDRVTMPGGVGPDAAGAEAATSDLSFWVLMPAILAHFALWAFLISLWRRFFERRGGASVGLTGGFGGLLRYGAGLVLGLGVFGFITVIATALIGVGPSESAPELSGVARLTSAPTLAVFAFILLVFLVQGGSEELIFRGWLMSTLSARWGVRAAVIISSLFFLLFHVHVFVSGAVFGIAALAGIGLLGLMFALLSLVTRSVVEAIAAHGAFNAAAVLLPSAALMAQDPTLTATAAVEQVFASATGLAGEEGVSIGPELMAQSLGGALACAGLAVLAARRKASAPWKANST